MKNKILEAKSLYELYQHLGLPVDLINSKKAFTIFNLRDMHLELPYTSISFRPNYFSFLFVKNGRGKYTIDEFSFNVHPNSIYFTNPSNYRTFSWEELEEVYLMTFDETFLKEYIRKDIFLVFPFLLNETISPSIVDEEFYEEVAAIYSLMHSEYKKQEAGVYEVIGLLLGALLHKIKNHLWQDYNPSLELNRNSQITKTFKQLLEQNFRDLHSGQRMVSMKVQDYADRLNLHPNYLNSLIKTKTGKSISTWIKEKTISEAKSLLQNSAYSIKEIAFILGFSETAHFSNYFKKHTGFAPKQYVKSI